MGITNRIKKHFKGSLKTTLPEQEKVTPYESSS